MSTTTTSKKPEFWNASIAIKSPEAKFIRLLVHFALSVAFQNEDFQYRLPANCKTTVAQLAVVVPSITPTQAIECCGIVQGWIEKRTWLTDHNKKVLHKRLDRAKPTLFLTNNKESPAYTDSCHDECCESPVQSFSLQADMDEDAFLYDDYDSTFFEFVESDEVQEVDATPIAIERTDSMDWFKFDLNLKDEEDINNSTKHTTNSVGGEMPSFDSLHLSQQSSAATGTGFRRILMS